ADVEAAAIEIFRRLRIELHRLLAGLGDPDELQEARAVGVPVLAQARHLLPETVDGRASCLVAVVGEVTVDVVHLRAPLPGLDRAAAGDPDRWMRLLHRPRPDIDVALLIESAVEGEGVALGPGAHDQVMGLAI